MQVFRHNWQMKLTAIVLAIIVHVYVRREQVSEPVRFPLPVSVTAPTGQRVVSPPPNYRVYVDLQGPAELVRSIQPDQVRLSFDTSGIRPGKPVSVPVSVVLPERYRGRVNATLTPAFISVHFVSDATRRLPVLVELGRRPAGWQFTEPPHSDPNTVTVSGMDDAIVEVDRVVARIDLEERERINVLATLRALDARGQVVTRPVLLEPAQVTVTAIQQRVVLEKRVPVQPVFSVPPGLRATVNVSPARVRLVGSEQEIGDIYLVETEPVPSPRGPGQVTRDVALISPRPGVQLSPARVRVVLKFSHPKAPVAAPASRPR